MPSRAAPKGRAERRQLSNGQLDRDVDDAGVDGKVLNVDSASRALTQSDAVPAVTFPFLRFANHSPLFSWCSHQHSLLQTVAERYGKWRAPFLVPCPSRNTRGFSTAPGAGARALC